jgi:hypothetical protein
MQAGLRTNILRESFPGIILESLYLCEQGRSSTYDYCRLSLNITFHTISPSPRPTTTTPTTAAAITSIFTMSHTAAGTFARLSLAEGLPVVVAVGEGEGEGDEEGKRTKVVMIVAVMTSIVRMFEGCCIGENRPGLGGMQ